MNNEILLSICCITYNHAKFIRQCLDGFVMQKTNFKFEVLIHDDASTDGTAEIIKEYEQKYPDIIKPIYQTENQWSKGVPASKIFQWPRIQGKYVALCEGDDYWIDPNKLQKQVDYLEAHPECSVCFHPVKVIFDKNDIDEYTFPTKKQIKNGFSFENLLQYNFIQTNSVVYRWRKDMCEVYPNGILPGDWYMHLLHAKIGEIAYLPDVMAVYRKHEGGIWYKDIHLKYAKQEIKFYNFVYKNITNSSQEYFNNVYLPNFKLIIDSLYQNGNIKVLNQIYDENSEIYLKAQQIKDEYKIKFKKYKKLFNTCLIISIIELCLIVILFFLKIF